MLDEYLALGGVELGNNARSFAYSACMCCAGLLKLDGCAGIHDATNPWTPATFEEYERTNSLFNPRLRTIDQWTSEVPTTDTSEGVVLTFDEDGPGFDPVLYTDYATAAAGEFWYSSMEVVIPPGESLALQVFTTTSAGSTSSPVEVYGPGVHRLTTPVLTIPVGVTGVTMWLTVGPVLTGQTVLVRDAILEKVEEVDATPGPYFDGSTNPLPTRAQVSWLGAPDESESLLEGTRVDVPAESAEPPYTCDDIALAPWFDVDNPFSAEFSGFYLVSVQGIEDGTYTAAVQESIEDGGVIQEGRYTTRSVRVRSMLIGCNRAATSYGLAWLKAALGRSFCARHGDACGTSDLAFFIDCPPTLLPDDDDYDARVAPYRRYLHDVACTSSPVIADEWATSTGGYVMVVEYILTAESPFVWGETIPVAASDTVLTAVDDIPYNLMLRPSAEQNDGVAAVVATQYAFNGSVEYGTTGWGIVQSGLTGVTNGQSTDIAAVGPNSYRGRFVPTSTGVSGTLEIYYDVALGSLPVGARPSVSIWSALQIVSGPMGATQWRGEVEWRTAGGAVLGVTNLGDFDLATSDNGQNVSGRGLTIPATAATARIRARVEYIDWVVGAEARMYVDAVGLTVP